MHSTKCSRKPASVRRHLRGRLSRFTRRGRDVLVLFRFLRRNMVTSAKKRFHMPRWESRGYGLNRPPDAIASFTMRWKRLERLFLALVVLLGLSSYLVAQDVNVHIEPRPPAAPKPSPDADGKPSGVSTD